MIHINVNCSDLERSTAFYRDTLGLSVITHTAPEAPQDGAAFGLGQAQWDAYIMGGADGFGRPVVDLLQWIIPTPLPRPEADACGFRVLRAGPSDGPGRHLTDPDGTAVQLVSGPPGFSGVVIGCSDLDASQRFYSEVVDLGDFVELVPGRGPAAPHANTLGMWRLALSTDDIDRDVAFLRRAGVHCRSDAVAMSMGPGLPTIRFVLFSDPDGTTLELIQRPGA